MKTVPGSRDRYPWARRVEHFEDESVFQAPRAAWSPGPWSDEPDIVEWRKEGVPYPLLIVRGHTGCLCGYVGVPEGHALHSMWSGDRTRFTWSALPEVISGSFACGPPIYIPTGEEPTCWWLGFHCGNVGEQMPSLPECSSDRYVPLDEVRARVEALAVAFFENPLPPRFPA